jgi:hypothetical protein
MLYKLAWIHKVILCLGMSNEDPVAFEASMFVRFVLTFVWD